MKLMQQRGVALVITLIMLSVITFLAVAFLALTRRGKAAVNVSLSQTDSRFMADIGLARAEAELVSRMIATTNMLNYDLMVTRNYIANGPYGNTTNLLDVSYVDSSGNPLTGNSLISNVANLFYDPRPPVFIRTNRTDPNDRLDFRFYIDVNRNGRFDTNGLLAVVDDNGDQIGSEIARMVGDPEWIGVLQNPLYPHSRTNRFIGRYAFLALPEGKTLDVNLMHNYAKLLPGDMADDSFWRNQGVGSWELNLAAFLQDLNPQMYSEDVNSTPYDYSTNKVANLGGPFRDALAMLRYRYRANPANANSANVSTLASVDALFGTDNIHFQKDDVDVYTDGPLMSSHLALTNEAATAPFLIDPTFEPWSGSRNPNAFRDPQEFFDVNKTSEQFVGRLNNAVAKTNSFDNQTFTRLLSQLGTTSDTNNIYMVEGKSYPKIHLNYDNRTVANGVAHQTNFLSWTPIGFFTNAAEAMIRQSLIPLRDNQNNNVLTNYYLGGVVGTNFNLTNIMVYPTNEYTPAVHRLLQLAANIYGASTNGFSTTGLTNAPVVFRPQFSRDGTNVFITGYVEVTTDGLTQYAKGFRDMKIASDRNQIAAFPAKSDENIYGIPWVISAKKGFPNFNEFSLETMVEIARRLEIRKTSATGPLIETNQMFTLLINSYVGSEFWNSYTSAFNTSITVTFTNSFTAVLTNRAGDVLTNRNASFGQSPTITFLNSALFGNTNSFFVANNTVPLVPESAYVHSTRSFTTNKNVYQRGQGFYLPDWILAITNRVSAIVTHNPSGRVLDFVNLGEMVTTNDLMRELMGVDSPNSSHPKYDLWNPTPVKGATGIAPLTHGITMQIGIGLGDADHGLWDETPTFKESEIRKFKRFMNVEPGGSTDIRAQVPFTPSRRIYVMHSWQANDPLVHYTLGDLVEKKVVNSDVSSKSGYAEFSESDLGQINKRYSPWGGKRGPGNSTGEPEEFGDSRFDPSIKDPMVRWSDDWDFPTNKFPNVGWLGRVHRGTPWQTVYLKSGVASNDIWMKWAGSGHTHPTNDWALLDVFTAAPNDNAARGLLSVNQTNLAGWSAVLSGVLVLTNSSNADQLNALKYPTFDPLTIEPSSIQLNKIVEGINRTRALTNRSSQTFTTVGELLSTPELTLDSPFLNRDDNNQLHFGLNDAAYERIPQQILSLLKVGYPRFVVYSYGQALRPAPNSIIVNAPAPHLQNICTNYQITGEVVTRTVLRVEGTPDKPKAIVESFQIVSEE